MYNIAKVGRASMLLFFKEVGFSPYFIPDL
jgi:hypothetical protein